jgi:phage gp46-like protein
MIDIRIIQTGDGGDFVVKGNDLEAVNGIENMPYLAMFGGDADWWANGLLFAENPEVQIKSTVEKTLMNTALNSSGRIAIENAVKKDLEFLQKSYGAVVTVAASITSNNRIELLININGNNIKYLWNPSTNQIII